MVWPFITGLRLVLVSVVGEGGLKVGVEVGAENFGLGLLDEDGVDGEPNFGLEVEPVVGLLELDEGGVDGELNLGFDLGLLEELDEDPEGEPNFGLEEPDPTLGLEEPDPTLGLEEPDPTLGLEELEGDPNFGLDELLLDEPELGLRLELEGEPNLGLDPLKPELDLLEPGFREVFWAKPTSETVPITNAKQRKTDSAFHGRMA